MKRTDTEIRKWTHQEDIHAHDDEWGDVFGVVWLVGGRVHTLEKHHAYGEVYETSFGYGCRLMRDGGYHYGAIEANAAFGLFRTKREAQAIADRINAEREVTE